MFGQMTKNEQAISARFSTLTSSTPDKISRPTIFLAHYSAVDVNYVIEGCHAYGTYYLPPNWYDDKVVGTYLNAHSGLDSFSDFFSHLTNPVGDNQLVVPIHGNDFFMLKRLGIFDLCSNNSPTILSRWFGYQSAIVAFFDEVDQSLDEIGKLDDEQFQWLFDQSFNIAQSIAVISTYAELTTAKRSRVFFEGWRKSHADFYSALLDSNKKPETSTTKSEPQIRADRERRLGSWLRRKSGHLFDKLYA